MTELLEDHKASVDGRDARTVTAGPSRDHCLAPERVDAPLGEGGRYGRMFDLPVAAAAVRAAVAVVAGAGLFLAARALAPAWNAGLDLPSGPVGSTNCLLYCESSALPRALRACSATSS
jgi:hypothetical protein